MGYRPGGQECYVWSVPRERCEEAQTSPKQLSPADVALALKVDERTVRRWAAADVIPAEHTTAGHHLISESTLHALQQLMRDKVPLNTRTLRGRFGQLPLEEGQQAPKPR